MSSHQASSLRKMLWILVPSLVLFIIMYLLTTHANEEYFLNFMNYHFGYSNRYNSYGPNWLIFITWDFGALAGNVVFVLVVGFVLCFLFVLHELETFFEFLFTIAGAVILLLILRFTFSTSTRGITAILFSNSSGFPSGHAFISLVLYSALAKYSGRKVHNNNARYIIYFFAALLIFLIGTARLFTSHNPTEVIAGWSIGLFWLAIVNYFFRKRIPAN